MFLEVFLVSICGKSVTAAGQGRSWNRTEHAIEPGQEFLSTVIGVEDNWDAVDGSNGPNESGT